jgi:hypothetical protein
MVLSQSADAQRKSSMTSFRHVSETKVVESLDWIGRFDPFPSYREWWKEIAECAGLSLIGNRMDSVEFFFVNAVDFAPVPTDKPQKMMVAVTYAASEQIYISIVKAKDERYVKHEMLHQILYWWNENDWDNDSRPEFKRCARNDLRSRD